MGTTLPSGDLKASVSNLDSELKWIRVTELSDVYITNCCQRVNLLLSIEAFIPSYAPALFMNPEVTIFMKRIIKNFGIMVKGKFPVLN
jgi:hypothetical protein